MKKLFLIVSLIILCGCTPKYNLIVDGNKVTENIFIPIEKSKIYEDDNELYLGLYSKDSVTNLINNDIYVESNSRSYVYKKNVEEDDDFINVALSFDYAKGRLNKSRVLNDCFENSEIKETVDGIQISLTGEFYCLPEEAQSIDFTISTKNYVESASTGHSLFTNDYKWVIDQNNKKNVDININISYDSKTIRYGLFVFGIIFGIAFVAGAIFVGYNLYRRKKINEI